MSYHPGGTVCDLRYREDTGIERRCPHCPKSGERWWSLTREFWDFKSFARCRACWAKHRRQLNRMRYAKDAALRLRRKEYKVQYDAETAAVRRIKNQAYYWSDPETQRQKARERYHKNRDRILAQKRDVYWASKAA